MRSGDRTAKEPHGAAEQSDEADEAFGGTVASTEVPPHARAGPFLTRAPLRSLSPVFGGPEGRAASDGREVMHRCGVAAED